MINMLDFYDVLGWGSLDVAFLNNRISEFNIDTDDLLNELDESEMDKTDINNWIYCCFYIAANSFLDEVENYSENENLFFDRNSIEIEIFLNYLDSGFFNGIFCDVDFLDLSDKNLISFIDKAKCDILAQKV